ncbi:MAG: dihydroorotate dehydrogenase electron transfer subunit [Eubacterium sp.]|jgi:dihydroorotate dehydrogenase electron transfer subunit
MKQQNLTITENYKVSRSLYAMRLAGDDDFSGVKPGSFIDISLPGFFLRRPISVCDAAAGTLTIVYKVLGAGTERMTELKAGSTLNVLTELGNGFDVAKAGRAPFLAGGGVGAAPMLLLAKKLSQAGVKPLIALGFETADDVFFEEEFAANASELVIATADGSQISHGQRASEGFCTAHGVRTSGGSHASGGSRSSGNGARTVQGLVTDAIKVLTKGLATGASKVTADSNPTDSLGTGSQQEAGSPSFIYACGPEKMLRAVYDATDCGGEFSFEERMGCGFGACMGCSHRTKNGYKRVCKDGPVFERDEIIWQI